MEFKDYYKILGVSEDASEEAIKRAYRKLARKYHPDVSEEADAETRFKEIGEAYEVLKDPEKRAEYDRLRQYGTAGGGFEPPPGWEARGGFGGSYTGVDPETFSEFFEAIFGGGGFSRGGFGGGFGAGMGGGEQARRATGEDLNTRMEIDLEDAYHGATRTLELAVPTVDSGGRQVREPRRLNVRIPAGITDGQSIRLKGQGAPGMAGGGNGDLYIRVHIRAHSLYTLDGRHLNVVLPVAPWEAALGATVNTPTPAGAVKLKLPANARAGQKLRLKGRGLPGSPPGDLYCTLKIVLPEVKSEDDKALFQQMAEQMPFNPRAGMGL